MAIPVEQLMVYVDQALEESCGVGRTGVRAQKENLLTSRGRWIGPFEDTEQEFYNSAVTYLASPLHSPLLSCLNKLSVLEDWSNGGGNKPSLKI